MFSSFKDSLGKAVATSKEALQYALPPDTTSTTESTATDSINGSDEASPFKRTFSAPGSLSNLSANDGNKVNSVASLDNAASDADAVARTAELERKNKLLEEKMKQVLDKSQDIHAKSTARMSQLTEENKNLQAKIDALLKSRVSRSSFSNRPAAATTETTSLPSSNDAADTIIATLKKENEQLSRKVKELLTHQSKVSDTEHDRTSTIESLDVAEQKKYEERINELEKTVALLKQQLAQADIDADVTLEKRNHELNRQNQELTEKILSLQTHLQASVTEVEERTGFTNTLRSQIDVLTNERTNSSAQVAHLKSQLEESQHKFTETIEKLKADNDQLTNNLIQKDNSQADVTKRIQDQLQEKDTQLLQLQESLNNFQNQQSTQDDGKAIRNDETNNAIVEHLQDTLITADQNESKIHSVEKEIAAVHDKNKTLEKEIETLQQSCNALKEQLLSAQKQVESQESIIKESKERMTELHYEAEQTQQQLTEQLPESTRAQAEGKTIALQQKTINLEKELDDKTLQIAKLQEQQAQQLDGISNTEDMSEVDLAAELRVKYDELLLRSEQMIADLSVINATANAANEEQQRLQIALDEAIAKLSEVKAKLTQTEKNFAHVSKENERLSLLEKELKFSLLEAVNKESTLASQVKALKNNLTGTEQALEIEAERRVKSVDLLRTTRKQVDSLTREKNEIDNEYNKFKSTHTTFVEQMERKLADLAAAEKKIGQLTAQLKRLEGLSKEHEALNTKYTNIASSEAKLRQELTSLRAKQDERTEALDLAVDQVQNLKSRMSMLEDELNTSKALFSKKSNEADVVRTRLSELENTFDDFKITSQRQLAETVGQCEAAKGELRNVTDRSTEALDTLRKQLQESKTVSEKISADKAAMVTQLAEAQAVSKSLNEQMAVVQAEVNSLREKLQDSAKQLLSAQASECDLSKLQGQTLQERQTLEQQLEETVTRETHLRQMNKSLKDEVRKLARANSNAAALALTISPSPSLTGLSRTSLDSPGLGITTFTSTLPSNSPSRSQPLSNIQSSASAVESTLEQSFQRQPNKGDISGGNVDYLRYVMLSFLDKRNMRKQLVPVLSILLKCTPEETARLKNHVI